MNNALKCRQCNAPMRMEFHGDRCVFVCPYCGDISLLRESDNVRISLAREETRQAELALDYRKHCDRIASSHTLFRIRTGIICAVAVVVLVLIGIFLATSH